MATIVPEDVLRSKYDFSQATIRGSTQITKRVSTTLTSLQAKQGSKTVIIAFQASARAANKAISIAEIVKRELKAQNKPVFQYTALTSESVTFKRKEIKLPEIMQEDKDVDSDDAFEPIKTGDLNGEEQRESPVLTIYLANASINELRVAYGEQKS